MKTQTPAMWSPIAHSNRTDMIVDPSQSCLLKHHRMIAREEPLHTCWVDENETHNVRKRIHTQLSNKLQYLEKGEVLTSDKRNHSDKDLMVKRKQVCWFYKYRECKFGKNCSYWHPPGLRQQDKDRYRDKLFESRDYGSRCIRLKLAPS